MKIQHLGVGKNPCHVETITSLYKNTVRLALVKHSSSKSSATIEKRLKNNIY